MLIRERDSPESFYTGDRGPALFTFGAGPGGTGRPGDHHQPSASRHIAEAEHRAIERWRLHQAPGPAAIIGGGNTRPGMRMPWSQIPSGHDTIGSVPERYGESAGVGVGHQRCVVRMPALSAIGGGQYPGDAGAAGGDPG